MDTLASFIDGSWINSNTFFLDIMKFKTIYNRVMVYDFTPKLFQEQPRCSRSYFYSNWYVQRNSKLIFRISKVIGINYIAALYKLEDR